MSFDTLLLVLTAAFIAGLVTNLLVPPVTRLAVALRALDHPGERKHQTTPVPRLGGVAILGGVGIAALGVALTRWYRIGEDLSRSEALVFALAAGLVFLLGAIDDVMGVTIGKKFLVQVAAALLLVQVGWSFSILTLPGGGTLDLGLFGPVLSVVWIVGVTNAVNLLDGLDGLAAGVVTIISGSLLVYAVLLGSLAPALLMAAVAGACLGFLRHNWSPAKIFMGDSGSLTLGFLLAAVSIHSSIKAPATVAVLVPLLALGLPVMDTLLVMVSRYLDAPRATPRGRFLRMFRADRSHVHHLMLHLGASRRGVVVTLYAAALGFCLLALLLATTQNPSLGLVLLTVELAALVALRRLDLTGRARRILRRPTGTTPAGTAPAGTGPTSTGPTSTGPASTGPGSPHPGEADDGAAEQAAAP